MLKTILRICTNIMLAMLWAYLALIDLFYFLYFHELRYFLFIVAQSLFAFLLIVRKPSKDSSKNPFDYIVALAGTFTVMLFRPTSFALVGSIVGNLFVSVGITIEILGFLSLNRSTGIVAANRGVKTGGMYAFVRHPIYFGNILFFLGFTLLNASIGNLLLLLACTLFQIERIMREEALLVRDDAYKSYMNKVKWRIIPGIF